MDFLREIFLEKKMLLAVSFCWILPSIVWLYLGWSELFGAFRAVGVIVAVISVSNVVSTMSWANRTERFAQLDDRISQVSMDISRVRIERNIESGIDVDNQTEALRKVTNDLAVVSARVSAKRASTLNQRQNAHESAVLKFDACVLSIATLQWGFGVWLSELIKCGATSC